MIEAAAWDRAVAAVGAARQAVLACHVGPDADALGSMLGLGLALRARGVEVVASWGDDPFEPPRRYAFLPGLDMLVPPAAVPPEPALMVTFDAGSADRLGSLEAVAGHADTLLVIDHHASNEGFGTIDLVDPHAAASAVIVHDLLARLGWALDADIATCLYAGLVTDTGRFQYGNTTPVVHVVAADLLAAGAPHEMITRVVYETQPIGFLRLASTVLERLRHVPEANLVWSWFTEADLVGAGIGMEDTEAMIDLIRTADVADAAALVKEQPDGRYKVSMRSKGETDVGAVCAARGGGGHRLAAGYTSERTDPEEAAADVIAALRA